MQKSPSSISSSSMNYSYDSSICSEESGWTSYFEEAFSDTNGGQQSSYSFCSSSLISDAASSAAWRSSNAQNLDFTSSSIGDDISLPKKLIFKKKAKTRKSFYDDSLEDTAISPVSSPKVAENQRKTLYNHTSSNVAKGRSSEKYSETEADDSTGLEKRGLCLVPLSMLVNYLG